MFGILAEINESEVARGIVRVIIDETDRSERLTIKHLKLGFLQGLLRGSLIVAIHLSMSAKTKKIDVLRNSGVSRLLFVFHFRMSGNIAEYILSGTKICAYKCFLFAPPARPRREKLKNKKKKKKEARE